MKHKCLNCGLPIEGDEERVPVEELRARWERKVAAGLRRQWSETSPVRYRHPTLEDCTEAEHKEARL